MTKPTIYYGSVINPTSLTSYDAQWNTLIAVNVQGNIDWVVYDVKECSIQETLLKQGYGSIHDVKVVVLKKGQFIMPGFIDTHTHAPQVPIVGTGYRLQLLEWLNELVFPMESKFKDVHFARKTYPSVVERFIAFGTTTCCYYGSLHLESTKVLADIVHSSGQRALIGKCNMDRECPKYYIEESAEVSVKHTNEFIHYVRHLKPNNPSGRPLVSPILTPRFAISCTPALLSSLSSIASSDPKLHIQTHLAENREEVKKIKDLFPKCNSYTEVYDKYGLLRENTILGHSVWLDDTEIMLIRDRKAGISHCPTSNFNLASGIAPVGKYLDSGLKVGLGTDVSGGRSMSMLGVIRDASTASTILALQNDSANSTCNCDCTAPELNSIEDKSATSTNNTSEIKFTNNQLSLPTLLYLATLGGAQVCAMEDHIGSFGRGKSFDALIIDIHGEKGEGNPGLWDVMSEWDLDLGKSECESFCGDGQARARKELDEMLRSFIFCGDDRNISGVYVQGRLIGGTSHRHGHRHDYGCSVQDSA